eukprot:9581187-Lingulodinium_polyedra.AAC.1
MTVFAACLAAVASPSRSQLCSRTCSGAIRTRRGGSDSAACGQTETGPAHGRRADGQALRVRPALAVHGRAAAWAVAAPRALE